MLVIARSMFALSATSSLRRPMPVPWSPISSGPPTNPKPRPLGVFRKPLSASTDPRPRPPHPARPADNPEPPPSRRLQEAVIRLDRPQQRSVEPASHQVVKHAFLALIRDHFRAARLPVFLRIGFELRAALHADTFAAQTLRTHGQRRTGPRDQT